jgi:hypothetical protein
MKEGVGRRHREYDIRRDVRDQMYPKEVQELHGEALHLKVVALTSARYRRDIEDTHRIARELAESKTHVDLFHTVDRDSSQFNQQIRNGRQRNINIISSGTSHYYGWGVYFGVDHSFGWKSEIGSTEYVFRNIPLDQLLPGKNTGQLMAVYPIDSIGGLVYPNPIEQIVQQERRYDISQSDDTSRTHILPLDVPATKLVASTDPRTQKKLLRRGYDAHSQVVECQNPILGRQLWWNYTTPSYADHVWSNTPLPSDKTLDIIDTLVGIRDIEVVSSPDVENDHVRIYAEERSPIICMATASTARVVELVFGGMSKEYVHDILEQKRIEREKNDW